MDGPYEVRARQEDGRVSLEYMRAGGLVGEASMTRAQLERDLVAAANHVLAFARSRSISTPEIDALHAALWRD